MGASAAGGRPLAVFLSVSAAVLACDQFTKALGSRLLSPVVPRPLLGSWLRLTLTHNQGSAFGLISSNWLSLMVGALVCLGILWYVVRWLPRHPQQAVALGLVFGGSLGNLLDRLRTRGVIDLIDVRIWPVFNVADIAITAGVGLMAIQMLRGR